MNNVVNLKSINKNNQKIKKKINIKNNKDVVFTLENLLEKAKNSEIESIVCVYISTNNEIDLLMEGEVFDHKTSYIGMLERTKIQINEG